MPTTQCSITTPGWWAARRQKAAFSLSAFTLIVAAVSSFSFLVQIHENELTDRSPDISPSPSTWIARQLLSAVGKRKSKLPIPGLYDGNQYVQTLIGLTAEQIQLMADDRDGALSKSDASAGALSPYKPFDSFVASSSRSLLVEFYSSYCGHCIEFAPTFKELAADIKGWSPVLGVVAINCADPMNEKVCDDNGVPGYPTIKYFPPFYTNGTAAPDFSGNRRIQALKHFLIRHLNNHTTILQPIRRIPIYNPKVTQIFICGDSSLADFGKEPVLNFLSHENMTVRLATMDVLRHVTPRKPLTCPGVYVMTNEGLEPIYEGADDVASLTKIKSLIGSQEVPVSLPVIVKPHPQRAISPTRPVPTTRFSRVMAADLLSALYQSLTLEVSLKKTVEGPDLIALRHFLAVLHEYFPRISEPTTIFIYQLNSHLEEIRGNAVDWRAVLKRVPHPPPFNSGRMTFVGCRGSTPLLRGYPCSLWAMFHALTVSAYEIDQDDGPMDVLHAMKGYIGSFFACTDCSRHFVSECEDRNTGLEALQRQTAQTQPGEAAVLWLWRTHNKVNRRLHGALSEDPRSPKIQFPDSGRCPSCLDPATNLWIEKSVFDFLLRFYSLEISNNISNNKDSRKHSGRSRPLARINTKKVISHLLGSNDGVHTDNDINSMSDSRKIDDKLFRHNLERPLTDLNVHDREPIKIQKMGSELPGLNLWGCAMYYILCAVLIGGLYSVVCWRYKKVFNVGKVCPSCCGGRREASRNIGRHSFYV